jgi:hypothetical protein
MESQSCYRGVRLNSRSFPIYPGYRINGTTGRDESLKKFINPKQPTRISSARTYLTDNSNSFLSLPAFTPFGFSLITLRGISRMQKASHLEREIGTVLIP